MKKLLIASIVTLAMGSCATAPRTLYAWHDYADMTYEYSKKPTDELKNKVLEEYQLMIDKQNGTRGVVPPGMFAEYGYMLYRLGKTEEGLKYMKQESDLYPESEKYISRIIKQLEK